MRRPAGVDAQPPGQPFGAGPAVDDIDVARLGPRALRPGADVGPASAGAAGDQRAAEGRAAASAPSRRRAAVEIDRRASPRRRISASSRSFHRALQLPDAEPDHHRDRRGDDERRDERQAASFAARSALRARGDDIRARAAAPLATAAGRRSAIAVSGTQSRTCTHQGGASAELDRDREADDQIAPTIRIRKAAGPSPTLNASKSSPQARQCGAKATSAVEQRSWRRSAGRAPAARRSTGVGGARGRPASAVDRRAPAAPDVDRHEQEQPDDVDEVPVPGGRLEAEMLLRA